MNIIDIIIILLLCLSCVSGFKRGFLREVIMLAGTIIIYIVSFNLKDNIGIILCKIFPFFKLNGLVTLNILIYQLIAFVSIAGILFCIFGFILKLTGILQKLVDLTIILKLPSKLLGAVSGLIEGYVVIFALLIIFSIPFKDNSLFINSNLNKKILTSSPILSKSLNNLDDVIIDTYDITNKINNKKSNVNSINLELTKMYLNYNVISKENLNDLIKSNKLKDVKGIQQLVDSYKIKK